ncbi:hypothetical protein TNCV_1382821 [Trichonephila clavipes]|nr:hypothetical protein TNCV_1382821 [Trichonephila clavipes]
MVECNGLPSRCKTRWSLRQDPSTAAAMARTLVLGILQTVFNIFCSMLEVRLTHDPTSQPRNDPYSFKLRYNLVNVQ